MKNTATFARKPLAMPAWHCVASLALILGLIVVAPLTAWAAPWRFGVLSDTQWRTTDDGQSPNTVPAGIIKQIDPEFIRHKVKFVVAVGDIVNRCTEDNLNARALYAQGLYNAGIGFYPLRGNHDVGKGGPTGSGPQFCRIFPQTRNGVNNATPRFREGLGVDPHIAPDPKTNPDTFTVGANFNSPDLVCNDVSKAGLTYSFDYDNARLVLLDQWDDSGSTSASTIPAQQKWITARLADPQRPSHAFVFAHKNLLGSRHRDNLFGSGVTPADPGDGDGVDPAALTPEQRTALSAKQAAENQFIGAMDAHGARYYLSGHDHLHSYSLVTSPNGAAKVRQVICQAASTNFPVPTAQGSTKKMNISEDTAKIGYYIYTIDGPRVTLDYYGAPVVTIKDRISKTPDLQGKWRKLETSGYSLNGREFIVPQGQSYTGVEDTTACAVQRGESGYRGTTAKILAGTNTSAAKTATGLPLTKVVNTGWAPAAGTLSDILTLWGMADLGAPHADTFALALSFPAAAASPQKIDSGAIALATKDPNGKWIPAVDANVGGVKKFVCGPYKPEYGLGVYGVDPAMHTAWAVINHTGEFAVVEVSKP